MHVFRLTDFEGEENEDFVRGKNEIKDHKLEKTKGTTTLFNFLIGESKREPVTAQPMCWSTSFSFLCILRDNYPSNIYNSQEILSTRTLKQKVEVDKQRMKLYDKPTLLTGNGHITLQLNVTLYKYSQFMKTNKSNFTAKH